MTIENYSFKEGLPIDISKDPQPQVLDMLEKHQHRGRILPAGEYDLTPEVWRKYGSNLYNYNLIVNEEGTATYRMLPKDKGVTTMVASKVGFSKPVSGGKSIRLPEDSSFTAIAGPKRGDPTFRVYEVVVYAPGPSPVDEKQKQTKTREQIKESLSDEIIGGSIRNIQEADRLIIEDAKKRVLALDWKHFGNLEVTPEVIFGLACDLSLRNSGMNFPLNVLRVSTPDERSIVDSLPLTHKEILHGPFFRVMLQDEISPEMATFIRDYLYIKAPDVIAAANKLPIQEVIDHFMKNEAFMKAGLRVLKKSGCY
ncbi:MAG: hypothetical protein Q7K55_01800 [Candidatus Levybacteria bacterium]|nr:hypothetical protein [Candidatus Levybacteria bacterium]